MIPLKYHRVIKCVKELGPGLGQMYQQTHYLDTLTLEASKSLIGHSPGEQQPPEEVLQDERLQQQCECRGLPRPG